MQVFLQSSGHEVHIKVTQKLLFKFVIYFGDHLQSQTKVIDKHLKVSPFPPAEEFLLFFDVGVQFSIQKEKATLWERG